MKLKYLTKVILIGILILMSAKMMKYHQARMICDKIKAGEEIYTKFSNGATAPIFFDEIATIMQIGGPRIPLVEACYYRNVQAVTILLENGADPNFFIKGRWSPLEAAIIKGPVGIMDEKSLQIVKLLVEHGCDVNQYASDEAVILRLSGNTIHGIDEIEKEMILYLLDHGAQRKYKDYEEIFSCIVLSRDLQFVKKLIQEYHFDVNEKGYLGQTPLVSFVSYPTILPTVEMVQLLLENGADKTLKDDRGKTAYDYAIERGFEEIALLLK